MIIIIIISRIEAIASDTAYTATHGVTWSVYFCLCLYVCLSVTHNREPYESGLTDRGAV